MNSKGTTIRKYAAAIKIIGIILTICLTIFLWIEAGESYSRTEKIYIIAGFINLITGIFISMFSAVLIDGFGELVENSARTNHLLEQMQNTESTENT